MSNPDSNQGLQPSTPSLSEFLVRHVHSYDPTAPTDDLKRWMRQLHSVMIGAVSASRRQHPA